MLDVWFKVFLSGIMVLAPIILLVLIPLTCAYRRKGETTAGVVFLVIFECILLLCFAVSTLGFTVVSIVTLLHRIWG